MRIITSLCLALILTLQSNALQVRASSSHLELTAEEKRAAAALVSTFMKRWEESGDMKQIAEELYAPDFINRFIAQERDDLTGDESFNVSYFSLLNFRYRPKLLDEASAEDWKQYYLASYGYYFCAMTIALNQMAGAFLHNKDVDETQMNQALERIIPVSMRDEIKRHPILKTMLDDKTEEPALRTIEEMRDVTDVLTRLTAKIKQERGSQAFQRTQVARRVGEKLLLSENARATLFCGEEELFFGLPKGTRIIGAATPMFFYLVIAKIEGEYKILTAIPISD